MVGANLIAPLLLGIFALKSGMRTLKFHFLLLAICLGLPAILAAQDSAKNAAAPEATTYQIRNVMYGELLRPRDANSAEGTPIVLYPAQPWKCMTWRLQPASDSAHPDATFHLKNLFTAKTFHAVADTNSAQQPVTQLRFPKNGGEISSWQFVSLTDGNYQILDAKSGNVLTAIKTDGSGEAHIVTAPWQNQDNQKWHLEKIDPKDLTM